MAVSRNPHILAIDLGTSGPKVALFTAGGELAGWEFEPTPVHLIPNGGAEQDPAGWWTAITTASRRLLARGLVPLDDITAVSVTTQWSGTVAVDREGRPLHPAIIWMDSRGAPYIKDRVGGWPEIQGYNLARLLTWLRITGGIAGQAGKDPIAHILFLQHERPEIYRAAYKFVEPKDYINLRLTGRFAASYDSITVHWLTDNRNIRRVDYSPQLLALSGVEREKFPDLVPPAGLLGPLTLQAARDLGLGENVQVATGTPDVFSAAVGSGAVRDYQAHLYLGTSSWLMCHVPFKKTDLFHNMAALPSAIPGRYIITNEQESAGACLNYLRDNLFFAGDELGGEPPDNVYAVFDRMVERVPAGSDGVIFTPWLYGERSPVEDHLVRSAFVNQSLHTRREHLVRAVFEGIAFNTRWLLGPVEKMTGRPLGPIHIVGGGAKSDVWCQICADVLNRPIVRIKDPLLANARGAAYIASVALGCLTFDDIPERVQVSRTFAPDPANRALYDKLFKEFVNIYNALSKTHRRLNG